LADGHLSCRVRARFPATDRPDGETTCRNGTIVIVILEIRIAVDLVETFYHSINGKSDRRPRERWQDDEKGLKLCRAG